jgi:hypothetical protein
MKGIHYDECPNCHNKKPVEYFLDILLIGVIRVFSCPNCAKLFCEECTGGWLFTCCPHCSSGFDDLEQSVGYYGAPKKK